MELIVISGTGTCVLLFALFIDFLLPPHYSRLDRATDASQDARLAGPTAVASPSAEPMTYDQAA
jgi:hypothetical protein